MIIWVFFDNDNWTRGLKLTCGYVHDQTVGCVIDKIVKQTKKQKTESLHLEPVP
jgi:hypothetical protein